MTTGMEKIPVGSPVYNSGNRGNKLLKNVGKVFLFVVDLEAQLFDSPFIFSVFTSTHSHKLTF